METGARGSCRGLSTDAQETSRDNTLNLSQIAAIPSLGLSFEGLGALFCYFSKSKFFPLEQTLGHETDASAWEVSLYISFKIRTAKGIGHL